MGCLRPHDRLVPRNVDTESAHGISALCDNTITPPGNTDVKKVTFHTDVIGPNMVPAG